jgi:hypothetical protein
MRQKAIIIPILVLLTGLFFSGCEKNQCKCFCSDYDAKELILNDTVELKYSGLYCNPEYEIRLSFDSISDSRCPTGAVCVWEGNASVRLIIQNTANDSTTFRLNTHGSLLSDTLVGGLHFELIDLLPYPELNKEYSLDDYTLQFLISD